MGKKIPAVMEAEKEKLLKGFVEYGKLSTSLADKLWKLIEPFAAYGFNKAHAASYGRVAYQTAYMKANYPEEYMSAVLTADAGDTEKISEIIAECVRMGIEVLPPDINESFAQFSVVPTKIQKSTQASMNTHSVENQEMRGAMDFSHEAYSGTMSTKNTEATKQFEGFRPYEAKIRFGLTTIKNFGEGISESIIEERKAHGAYASLQDFLTRVTSKNLNKKSLEALIMSGSFDCFHERGQMLGNIDTLLAYHKEHSARRESAQDSLFGSLGDSSVHTLSLAPVETATKEQKLLWEKELLGVYVSGHPLDAYREEIEKRPRISTIKKETRNGIPVVTAGMVEGVHEILTKKGDKMGFITIGDGLESIEIVTFPETYKTHHDLFVVGSCVAVQGKLSMRNEEPTIVIDRIKSLNTTASTSPSTPQV